MGTISFNEEPVGQLHLELDELCHCLHESLERESAVVENIEAVKGEVDNLRDKVKQLHRVYVLVKMLVYVVNRVSGMSVNTSDEGVISSMPGTIPRFTSQYNVANANSNMSLAGGLAASYLPHIYLP